MPKAVLITGASSGLGLAFLRHYHNLNQEASKTASSNEAIKIIALDNKPLAPDLDSCPDISFFRVDVTFTSSLIHVSQHLASQGTQIDILIHSAGIRGLVQEVIDREPGDVAAAETYAVMNQETMLKTFEINTGGTFNVIRAILPSLSRPGTPRIPPAKVVVMSSRMGSMSSNTTGGAYAYRASKAALNAVVKSFAVDVPDVAFLMLHPGRVETGLVAWKEEGAFGVDEVLGDCLKVIEKMGLEESGRFVDRLGKDIGW